MVHSGKNGRKEEQGSPLPTDCSSPRLYPGTSQTSRRSYGNYQEPIEPWHEDCCSWEEPEAGRHFAAKAGHLKHLLVPPGLATGIRAWAARTRRKETNVWPDIWEHLFCFAYVDAACLAWGVCFWLIDKMGTHLQTRQYQNEPSQPRWSRFP